MPKVNTNKLRGVMAERRLTHAEVAELLKIAPYTFSKRINGKAAFTLPEAKILADYFDKPIEELFFKSDKNAS